MTVPCKPPAAATPSRQETASQSACDTGRWHAEKEYSHHDLQAARLDAQLVRRALAAYGDTFRYRQALQPGAVRIDLAGNPASEVTADQARHAQQT